MPLMNEESYSYESSSSSSWESHSSSGPGGRSSHSSEALSLSRTVNGHSESLTVTRDGNEVRVVRVEDGETKDDRVVYSGDDADGWLQNRMIEWRSEGYQG
jgi:hypothetical protein